MPGTSNGRSADEGCKFILCSLFIVHIGSGFCLFYDGLFVQQAEAWEVQTAWRQTKCKVLAAGVSCDDTGLIVPDSLGRVSSTCAGYKAGAMPNQSVPVFLTEQIAVCPGTYWCAKEGDMCNCKGEITYSRELFDGHVYTVPEAERAYKVMSNGMWKCGTDQSGVQYKVDPAPWHVKHCFCTPDGIQELLRPYGAEHLHKKECSENVNFDFESKGRRLKEATHRARSLLQRARARLHELWEPRQLASIARRTYCYTPWALVTVEDEDPFHLRTKYIRCAYEYGVPQASHRYCGTGPYNGGEVWDAENVALAWGKDPLRDCWVRTQSQSQSVNGGFCGVSMAIPGTLQEKARGDMHVTSILFYSCTIFNLFLGYIFRNSILEALKKCRAKRKRMLEALQNKFRSVCTQSSESSEEENLNGT